jgi:hypothetical protein
MLRYTTYIAAAFIMSACSTKSETKKEAKTPQVAPVQAPVVEARENNLKMKNSIKAVVCKRGETKRYIWTEGVDGKGCKLWYSNYSKPGPAAWSSVSKEHCLKIGEGISKKLQSAGYQCAEESKFL